jgi:hypothetical protein
MLRRSVNAGGADPPWSSARARETSAPQIRHGRLLALSRDALKGEAFVRYFSMP